MNQNVLLVCFSCVEPSLCSLLTYDIPFLQVETIQVIQCIFGLFSLLRVGCMQ